MSDIEDLLEEDAAEQAERDPNTADMFGAGDPPPPPPRAEGQAPADGGAYTVLARKYRPRTFEDLIGQEAMVRTLRNAFATGRIAHAFMLTGVRGVGKTTTARLLARALNAEREGVDRPTIELTDDGKHDRAIMEGRHLDVLELDAATRTKVDEMRELLEGVRYAPVQGRYKVIVLDEVHMLSTAAFNALLKTLEEPPPHAKFIFATTEIRKVPVTILSRCQRFDLRRVEPDVLSAHLRKVLAAEGAEVEEDGLALIARAAEGSVRDALSLLDQAIVQAEPGRPVSAEVVRDMLGLADRAATIALFETVMRGEAAETLAAFRTLYGYGADPAVVMLDVLEHCHGASVAKALGPGALTLPKEQAARLASVGAAASAGVLSRLWQMLLKAHEEVRKAPQPAAAAEMALLRLCYAADLPGPEEALRRLQGGEAVSAGPAPRGPAPGGGGGATATARSMPSPQPSASPVAAIEARASLQSFDDLLALIAERRDVPLKLDVERFMRPVGFRTGVVEFEPAPGMPNDLTQRLARRLREWTGQPWLIAAQGGGGGETAYERQKRERAEQRAALEADPFVAEVMRVFPGTEIVGVRELPIGPAPVEESDESD
jgi:DNA polymerase III subunit gamma/tau